MNESDIEPGPEDKPFETVFSDGRFITWHTPNCIIWTREWNQEKGYGAHCSCGGYDRKRVAVSEEAEHP